MITKLMPVPKQQYFAIAGIPLVGGKVYTYEAGTTNPKPTYTDAAGTEAQPNPITLNARGEPPKAIFWSGNYRVDIRDAIGNLIYTVDNYNTDPAGLEGLLGSGGAALIGYGSDTVGGMLDALKLPDYTALRNYAGPSPIVTITGYLANAAPDGIAGDFIRDDNDSTSADNDGTIIVTTKGKRYKRVYSGPVNAQWFHAKGDNTTDDTAAIQKALNFGHTFLPKTASGYKITGTLYVDYSIGSLHSDGATINSSAPQGSPAVMVFSSANYGADGKAPYTKNYVREACMGFILVGTRQAAAPAGGTGNIAFQVGRAGDAYFQSGDAEILHCAVFGFDTQVLFADNGWRTKFKECSLTGGSYPIWFNSPNNSGEVMTFEGCWIVGWTNSLMLSGGYFLFHRCSLFGTATGIFVTQNSAYVVLRDCNTEVANARTTRLFSIETTSRLTIDGGAIVFDSTMGAPVFVGDASFSMLTLEGVSLPLYGDAFKYEQNAYGDNQVRAMVQRGTSLIVQARGCFPKAGVIPQNTSIQSIIGGPNLLSNGDASRLDITPWTVSSGAAVVSTSNPRNGPRCFVVTGGAIAQNVNVMGQSGRWFSFGFWAQARAGAGNIGNPKVLFVDIGLTPLAIYTAAAIDGGQAGWTWYAFNGVVPDGANLAQMQLDAGVTAATSVAFDDVYFDIY